MWRYHVSKQQHRFWTRKQRRRFQQACVKIVPSVPFDTPLIPPMATISQALTIAMQQYQAGKLAEAERIYQQILAVDPRQADALHMLGYLAHQQQQSERAKELVRQAIESQPNMPTYFNSLGIILTALKELAPAVKAFHDALALQPNFAEAHYNLGYAYNQQGRTAEAIASYLRVLELKPTFIQALNNLGNIYKLQGKPIAAVDCYQRALKIDPQHVKTLNNLGNIFQDQGNVNDAMACYQQALRIDANYPEALNSLGSALLILGKPKDALAWFQQAVQLKPHDEHFHNNLGNALQLIGNTPEALRCYRRTLELNPHHLPALGALLHESQNVCEWRELTGWYEQLFASIANPQKTAHDIPVSPFSFLTLSAISTAAQQQQAAQQWVAWKQQGIQPASVAHHTSHDKTPTRPLKIGYLSADLHDHATSRLMIEMLEKHNSEQFVTTAYSFGLNDGSPMRTRLMAAFDEWREVKTLSHEKTAQQIAHDQIDILIDLKGYTEHSRTQILAYRPAPIQVNFLGYPGTMGADFIDYIFVDEFIVPPDQQPYFTEKLVHLPGCYQPNDSQRSIAEETPSRTACGLPESGFVFCSFNNNYKITPAMFDTWMQLLHQVPASVLWLLEGNPYAPENLRREATLRGIAPERLIFAPRMPVPEHLARHRLADLFLDTFPVNAHTTASDALWAGLPLLTLAGETFISRVAGSLLQTLGLSELITHSMAEYAALAYKLATHPTELAALRATLEHRVKQSTLYNAQHFARKIEAAFRQMWINYCAGNPPIAFRVTEAMLSREST
jgi:protein O-GlcNAc transferase